MSTLSVHFLSVENILQAHDFSLTHTGGSAGLRDLGLLQSAAMMAQQQFGGFYLHEGLASKATAYMYHIAANHPFVDGNKRTATLAALIFLDINEVEPLPSPEELEMVTWATADGSLNKAQLTEWFQKQIGEISEQE